MTNLEDEIKKLGYPYEKMDEGFDVEVSIPKWDIEDVVNIYGDEEKYYIDDYSGWEVEFFYKEDFTLAQAIENYYHPIED